MIVSQSPYKADGSPNRDKGKLWCSVCGSYESDVTPFFSSTHEFKPDLSFYSNVSAPSGHGVNIGRALNNLVFIFKNDPLSPVVKPIRGKIDFCYATNSGKVTGDDNGLRPLVGVVRDVIGDMVYVEVASS